jgi:hypothetical protein
MHANVLQPIEQVIVSLFTEVKRHKPSVIYIPAIDGWWPSLSDQARATFTTMLKSIPATDPVLLLATAEVECFDLDEALLQHLFGFSKKNRAVIERPNRDVRIEYFSNIIAYARKSPNEFPDPADRKKRVLEDLPIAPPPPPRVLTKAEIKAERKADLHSLNILKTQLQPIMDQIHRKYRKFRQPVIPINQIAYLFEEQDPNYVRPDLAEGENRPYEIAKDKEGTDGIRDTVTGKFFYNLETTTIEERLANGYYARPRDYYSDINKLYSDAKNIGDRERTLKANELRTNVEVDVTDIELRLTNMGIRFEEIYQRQLKRAKEEAEKLCKRKAMKDVINLVGTDLTQEDSDSQGPVGIGLPLPGANTTRARFQVMSPQRSNGHGTSSGSHPLTNGNSVPSSSHNVDDTEMTGMDDSTQPFSAPLEPMQPPWPTRSRPLGDSTRATAGTTQVSQVSAITTVPHGMSPSAIANDASTTKTSDPSTGRDSGPWNTQMTHGLHNSNPEQQSQMPDTQPQYNMQSGPSQGPSQSTSDSQWAHSQAHGLARGILKSRADQVSPTSSQVPPAYHDGKKPAAASAALGNILNSDESSRGSHGTGQSSLRNSGVSTSSSQPQVVIDEAGLDVFLNQIATSTSGCTIEQLEQIYRELMDEIWKTRHEWNRMKVLSGLKAVFNDTIADIEALQGLDQSSQEKLELELRENDGNFVILR